MLREAAGVKQFELAEKTDRSVDGISMIERGDNWPTADTIERIATAFGIPASDLFDGLESKTAGKAPQHLARARATLARLPKSKLLLAVELLEALERSER